MTNPNKANRKAIVDSVSAFTDEIFTRGWLKDVAVSQGIMSDDFWIALVVTKSGTLPKENKFFVFGTEQEATEFVRTHPVGSEFPTMQNKVADGDISKSAGEKIFADPLVGQTFFSAGDQDAFVVFDTKQKAGLSVEQGASRLVSDYLGKERTEVLASQYGANWSVVADMEYCWYNLPSSASAYIASQQAYNYYIAKDDFSAGYLLRDLEILVNGTEEAAARAVEFAEKQAKRSAKGGVAQAEKAEQRRRTFFSLALECAPKWVWRSQNEQLRYLKNAAADRDTQTGDALFQQAGKLLSDTWFEDALSILRQSGELERAISPRKP